MRARIIITKGKDKGKSFLVAEGKPITVGRSSAADISLAEPRISRIHCRFTHDGKHIMLTDLNSTNGTFVNERKIKSVPLADGDTIRIGETVMTMHLEKDELESKQKSGAAEGTGLRAKIRPTPQVEAEPRVAKIPEERVADRDMARAQEPPTRRAPAEIDRPIRREIKEEEDESPVMGLFDKWLDEPQKKGEERVTSPRPPIEREEEEERPPVTEAPSIPGVELKKKLGEDPLGESYEAVQLFLGRPVAVRVLYGAAARDKAVSRDFIELARAKAKLNHPNIVQVYDAGRVAGAYYLVSEMPEGVSLDVLMSREGSKRPLNPNLALEIALQVSRALRRAHAERLVHWDLQPRTVFISRERVAKIGGFTYPGIVIRNFRQAGEMTSSLPVHPYQAPELIHELESADVRADVYGLGAVLYEMVCGRPPFLAENERTLMEMILRERPETPQKYNAALPSEICLFILKCLAKDPANRYSSAAEIVQEIKALPRVKTPVGEE